MSLLNTGKRPLDSNSLLGCEDKNHKDNCRNCICGQSMHHNEVRHSQLFDGVTFSPMFFRALAPCFPEECDSEDIRKEIYKHLGQG